MAGIYKDYLENFEDEFSVTHKITPRPEKESFHMHSQLEIIYAISGNLKCRTETKTVDIPSHSLILFNTMDLHYVLADEGVCDRYVLYFSASFIASLSTPEINLLECFNSPGIDRPMQLPLDEEQIPVFLNLLEQMIHCQDNAASSSTPEGYYGSFLQIRFLLGQFLLLANQLSHLRYGSAYEGLYPGHRRTVTDICGYIHEHLRDEITADSLAASFSVSKTSLYNMFNEVLGMSALDYLRECRMNRAKNYLINSEYPVEIIGEISGYNNLSSFSRAFKVISGMSPLKYRQKFRATEALSE